MLLLMIASVAAVTTNVSLFEVGTSIDIGLTIMPQCPKINQTSLKYFVDTYADVKQICNNESVCMGACSEKLAQGRSYAFDGETISFDVDVTDNDGIITDCVKTSVTLTQGQNNSVVAGCSLIGDPTNGGKTGHYHCVYTVLGPETVQGEFWASVKATDSCGAGCSDAAAGVFSLYLNPEVALSFTAQQPFKFGYDINGANMTPSPGSTVYSPYFKIQNVADPKSGLYILMGLYGTDMYANTSAGGPAPICPTTNVLDIKNVAYMADHLNIQQPWTVMPENYAGRRWVFQNPAPFAGNFMGIGDDITARLRMSVPSPCKGSFTTGGHIVFMGTVI